MSHRSLASAADSVGLCHTAKSASDQPILKYSADRSEFRFRLVFGRIDKLPKLPDGYFGATQ